MGRARPAQIQSLRLGRIFAMPYVAGSYAVSGRRHICNNAGSENIAPICGRIMMRIGVAGVGRMGAAIAAHLLEVGHKVTVWNRTADKVRPLVDAGAKAAGT